MEGASSRSAPQKPPDNASHSSTIVKEESVEGTRSKSAPQKPPATVLHQLTPSDRLVRIQACLNFIDGDVENYMRWRRSQALETYEPTKEETSYLKGKQDFCAEILKHLRQSYTSDDPEMLQAMTKVKGALAKRGYKVGWDIEKMLRPTPPTSPPTSREIEKASTYKTAQENAATEAAAKEAATQAAWEAEQRAQAARLQAMLKSGAAQQAKKLSEENAARKKAEQEASKKREKENREAEAEISLHKRQRQHLDHASRVRSCIETLALNAYKARTAATAMSS